MDTSPTTEDMTPGPRSLMSQIQDCWDSTHETDPARAAEAIVERMMKDGASAKEIICRHLDIGTFNPEVVVRAIIAAEYARSLTAEDRLVGVGLTPLTAECAVTLIDCADAADEAAGELMQALTEEDFSVLCRQVRETTGLTDLSEAAQAMLAQMGLSEMLPPPSSVCGHNARRHILAAMAEHYAECL